MVMQQESGHPSAPKRWPAVLVAIIVTGLVSCSGRGHRPPPLDKSLAQKALATALDAWKEGKRPESLRAHDPPIVVGDPDWEQGWTLLDYRPGAVSWDDGSNQYSEVVLTITKGREATVRRTATYVISTRPAITVIRE